jgi:hypothetical protein
MRSYLLDIAHFDKLLGQLVAIAQDESKPDEMRSASLTCIMNFLKNN